MSKVQVTRRRTLARYATGGTLRLADGRSVRVTSQPVTIGRDASADLCVDDPEVSALHCELKAVSKGVLLRDLGSTNGTHIGPVAVVEVLLTQRCTLKAGGTEIEFDPEAQPHLLEGDAGGSFGPLVGASPAMKQLYKTLATVAHTELSVLVTGETGTGKELVAKALHEASARIQGPFVVVDCGALPMTLAESVLFGHEKGAFTGAIETKVGAFEQAHGGTLFLDEIGELPEALQPKLLRAVAERSIKRVGGSRYQSVDVRIVAATRRDVRREVNAGRFRDDLFFRLAQIRVETTPLRERQEDIPLLIERACERINRHDAAATVTKYIESRFRRYDWPGNVRELVNVAAVLAALGSDDVEGVLPMEGQAVKRDASGVSASGVSARGFVQAKRQFEEEYFQRLLDATEGNISEIARRCGLARHQVRGHLRKLGLSE